MGLQEQTGPQVGQYYCNSGGLQGHSCIEIVSGSGGNTGYIPGVPSQISVSNPNLPTWSSSIYYNTLQDCETSCSNHYPWNCWNSNNGNSSPNVSFPHLTTTEKDNFCTLCQNDVAGSLIKSSPYCWCLDNGTGPHPQPPGSMWTGGNYVYSCPGVSYGCTDQAATNYDPNATSDDGSCTYPVPGAQITAGICMCPPPPIGPGSGCSSQYTLPNTLPMSSAFLTIGGQTPQVGDKFYSDCYPQVFSYVCVWEVTAIGNTGTSQGNRPIAIDCNNPYIPGCTDSTATNYDPSANLDDGSCTYDVYGCTDPNATNYDSLATIDDGSCVSPNTPPIDPCEGWPSSADKPVLVSTCCEWCKENAYNQPLGAGIPPTGCYDWMCDCPHCHKRKGPKI